MNILKKLFGGTSSEKSPEPVEIVRRACIIAEPTSACPVPEKIFCGPTTVLSPPEDLVRRADQAMQLDGALLAYGGLKASTFQAFPNDEVRRRCFEKLATEWADQLHIKFKHWYVYFETGSMGIRYNVFVVVDKEALDMRRLSQNTGLSQEDLEALANVNWDAVAESMAKEKKKSA